MEKLDCGGGAPPWKDDNEDPHPLPTPPLKQVRKGGEAMLTRKVGQAGRGAIVIGAGVWGGQR